MWQNNELRTYQKLQIILLCLGKILRSEIKIVSLKCLKEFSIENEVALQLSNKLK